MNERKILKTKPKVDLYAPIVVVCDGVHSKFRKDVVSAKPVANSSFCGFVLDNCNVLILFSLSLL